MRSLALSYSCVRGAGFNLQIKRSTSEQENPSYAENLLEDTDGLLRPPLEGGTKQPISVLSVLSGAVPGSDRFLLTSASLADVIAFEGTRIGLATTTTSCSRTAPGLAGP